MVDPIKPRRAELAAIVGGDGRLLKAFERLFKVAGDELPAANATSAQDAILQAMVPNGGDFEARRNVLRGLSAENFVFVSDKFDFPAAVGGVINLKDNVTYFVTTTVDLLGDRLVGGRNTTILGASSENCRIKSTGLTDPLISSEWSLPMRHIALEADHILDLDAGANANQALDWYGVNLLNTSNAGTIQNYSNFIATSMAFLSATGMVFDGSFGTIGFSECIFVGNATGTILTVADTAVITRRFRIKSSAFIVFASAVGIDFSVLATVPAESFILDNMNFSGGATYIAGVQYDDNKAMFTQNIGIDNSASISNYYMNNNATATVIATANTPTKILGTTTSDPITQRFANTANRATYSGEVVRKFKVSANLTFTNFTGDQCAIYVAINGAVIPQSAALTTANVANRGENVVTFGIVEMGNADFVEIWIENRSGGRNVTVTDLNVNMEQIA